MSTQPEYETLIKAAHTARERAYIPYSNFAVGAAVLTASGQVFLGCNIENASYPVTNCAERVALGNAYAAGEREIVAIAVVGDTIDPISPCGMCRQAILELAPNAKVILTNLHENTLHTTPQELLPGGFTPTSLTQRP
jgi:cytidine deaminase